MDILNYAELIEMYAKATERRARGLADRDGKMVTVWLDTKEIAPSDELVAEMEREKAARAAFWSEYSEEAYKLFGGNLPREFMTDVDDMVSDGMELWGGEIWMREYDSEKEFDVTTNLYKSSYELLNRVFDAGVQHGIDLSSEK